MVSVSMSLRVLVDALNAGMVSVDERGRLAFGFSADRSAPRKSQAGNAGSTLQTLKRMGASPREIEVFCAKRTGVKVLVAAMDLGMSPRTAEAHLRNLYRRLGVHTFVELEAKLREEMTQARAGSVVHPR